MWWLSRDSKEIELCDGWSKEFDSSDYWLEEKEFSRLEKEYGPFVMDYFASERSHRMKPFMARFGVGEAEGCDAFSVSWREGRGFFHPPVGTIWRVIRKAERDRAQGVLVVPDWPGSGFLSLVEDRMDEGRLLLREKFWTCMICPNDICSKTFRGRLKFRMCVFEFNF